MDSVVVYLYFFLNYFEELYVCQRECPFS